MSIQTLPNAAAVDLTPEDSSAKTRRWWNPFQRSDRPRRNLFRSRQSEWIEDFQAEHRRLVETLDRLNDRIGAKEASSSSSEAPSMELDPMPVIEGIRGISKGQKEITASIDSLSQFVQRAEQTDERLVKTVTQVDRTLTNVQSTHSRTVDALGEVTGRIDSVTERFEKLFARMAESERAMADDYRKLQHRTLMAVSGIGATALGALALFLASPWG
jgi:chromosome segregation ATPase